MANTLKFGAGEWATKEGSTLAFNDENGNFKPLPFNFERAGSATRVNKEGLIEVVSNNEPRIDFKDSNEGALLLEPQRTNHFQQSNQFDTTWQISAVGISVTPNQVGVGNSQDAWKLTEGAFDGEHYIRQTPNIGGVVSVSVYAKAGTNDFLYIRGVNGGLNKRTWFNLSNGTVGTSQGISAEMISMGDGWYRCVMVLDHQTAFEYYIGVSNADGVSSYQGSNKYIYIQNAQLEQGSYPTSYIPTNGATATRNAETSSKVIPTDISLSTRGTVFLDYTLNINLIAGHFPLSIIDYNNGSVGEWTTRGSFRFDINTNGNVTYDFVLLSSSITNAATVVSNVFTDIGSRGKMAISWDGTNVTFSVNGVNYQDTLSANFTGSLDGIYLGILGTFNNTHREGKFNEVKLYDTKLTDQELIALTS